jgi:hypothetical protein
VFNTVLRIAAGLLVAATSVFAQSPDQSQTPVFRGGVDLVTVDMTVVDGDLHSAARFIDRLPATDRVSVAVLPQWETALRFDASREALKDRLLRGSGTGAGPPPR